MTSKLKCPICGEILQKYGEIDPDTGTSIVLGANCRKCGIGNSDIKLWQALIQAKQDLEILKQALEKYADEDMWETCNIWEVDYIQSMFLEYGYKIAKEALEQIEHKE